MGWVSLSDTFLLTTVIGFFIASIFAEQADDARQQAVVAEQNARKARQDEEMVRRTIEELRAETNRLQQAMNDLRLTVEIREREAEKSLADLRRRRALEESNRVLEESNRALQAELASHREEREAIEEILKKQNAEANKMAMLREEELRDLREKLEVAQGEKERASGILATNQQREAEQGRIRQEVLGLKGDLGRVVFVFDRSASMRKGGRWNVVKSTAQTWMEYLPVNEAALVVFSTNVDRYPADGEWVDMTKPVDRDRLVQEMEEWHPSGFTETLLALKTAYSYEGVDAIVLFTDGLPTSSGPMGDLVFTRNRLMKEIHSFVTEQREGGNKTRIHTVGLGDYFDDKLGEFLLKLARDTEGTFIGR